MIRCVCMRRFSGKSKRCPVRWPYVTPNISLPTLFFRRGTHGGTALVPLLCTVKVFSTVCISHLLLGMLSNNQPRELAL
jgi:hypothetical protein